MGQEFFLVPKLSLGTQWRRKAPALQPQKRSFTWLHYVPKLELGNEGKLELGNDGNEGKLELENEGDPSRRRSG